MTEFGKKVMKNTKTASLEELRAMKEKGELLPTRPDAPELNAPEGFWDTAELQKFNVKGAKT